jgi:hypothetical protein
MLKKALYSLSFIMLAISLLAQNAKIETDRPDQTETPFTTPKNGF